MGVRLVMALSLVKQKGFRQLLDAAADATFVVDAGGNVAALNPEAERVFGWSEAELLGEPMNKIIAERFQQLADKQIARDGEPPGMMPKGARASLFARRRDGSEFPVEFNSRALGASRDALVVVTLRDLTEWRRAQETLFREKEQAFVTLASIADAVITTDLAGTITYLNPMAERLTGWRTAEALGQPLDTVLPLISEATRQLIESIPARCLNEGRTVDLADGVLLLRRDGTEVPIGDSAAPIRDRNGATTGVVVVFHDVTERRRVTRTLSHQATHDSLTGLISRAEFERRLGRALAEAAAGGAEHALCYLDLDRFKLVNDTCGHEAGDGLLRAISNMLTDRLRSRDIVGRLGGDEFGVLLEHCSLTKAEEIARNLQRAIKDFRYMWGHKSFSLGASIGIVPIAAASGRIADVLRSADSACYAAKEAGGNRIHCGTEAAPGSHQQMETRRMTRLTRAVEESSFQLFAQAIIPLAPEAPPRLRCEILLRLPDEGGGVEDPGSFLPQAERHRLMPAIDRWVVRQTVALLARWQRDHRQCELPLCSINLSVSSLEDTDLVPAMRGYLTEHRLAPEALCFEIAEPAAFGNFAQLVRLVSEIRTTGCGIGLDDFGSGLTSFAHLRALPVDFVKIGGHYVRGVVDDPVYGTLVSVVNQIGRIMGIATIAQGVESEAILQQLRVLGVEYAQGHAVAPPVPLVDADGDVALPCVQRSA
jgi:diguanylate cyclase (GGDEF)-like protein/PAS domain S-box-containing protein